MSRRPRALLLFAVWVGAVSSPLRAAAQPTPEDRAVAETLFQQARRLMDEKRYGEACPKLEESQRVAPAGGTLLNLAACHEAVGRIAAAWSEFRDAEAQAIKAGRADRQKIARERLDVLAPQVPKLVVVVSPELAALAPRLTRDGTEIGAAAWGVEIPLDPGPHVVRVVAAGWAPWEAKVELVASRVERLVVPPLEPLAVSPPALVPIPPASTLAPAPAVSTVETPAAPPPASPLGAQRIAGWGVVGAAAVALGVGTYFGLHAMKKRSDSDAQCEGRLCTPEGFFLNEEARTAARSANVFLGLGALVLGGGLALVLTAPAARTEVSIGLGATSGRVSVQF